MFALPREDRAPNPELVSPPCDYLQGGPASLCPLAEGSLAPVPSQLDPSSLSLSPLHHCLAKSLWRGHLHLL